MPVWPGAYPAESGSIGPERVRAPEEAPTTAAKWITNVSRPTLSLFRPAAHKNAGTAVVICPGGGYWNLAWDLEGQEVAARLNALGITALVLKYRAPRRPGEPERLPAPGPLHVSAQGGHGFGVRESPLPCSTWIDRCAEWLSSLGLLVQATRPPPARACRTCRKATAGLPPANPMTRVLARSFTPVDPYAGHVHHYGSK